MRWSQKSANVCRSHHSRRPASRDPMSHHHHHHGCHAVDYHRAFAIGVALNVGFVVVEAVFGFLAGSLALLADAGHNLSDVLSLLLAWGASYLATRPPTRHRTYGLRRSTILASLLNAVLLLLAIGAIGWEAVRRFAAPAEVAGTTVIWVAAVGVVINTATALLFMSGRNRDLNIKGAFLHMAADAGVSLGVVVAGVAIILTGQLWIDPSVSLVIVAVIAIGTWGLLRDSLNLALDAVPEGIDPAAVEDYLKNLAGVYRGARPPHLGHEHDRSGANRPLGDARRRPQRRALGAGHQRVARSIRHRARHDSNRERRRRSPLPSRPGGCGLKDRTVGAIR